MRRKDHERILGRTVPVEDVLVLEIVSRLHILLRGRGFRFFEER